MTVADPVAAAADPQFKSAVEEGIADTANVNKNYVNATLSAITVRRLAESIERRLANTVHVEYTITMPSDQVTDAQAAAAHSALSSVTQSAMTTTLNTKLASVTGGNYTVSVTQISTPSIAVPTTTTTVASNSNTNSAQDDSKAPMAMSMMASWACIYALMMA
jgi:hypothetical protein